MDFKDKESWDKGIAKNTDPYGAGIYAYAKDWAELMEQEMREGKRLEDIAEETSQQADIDGITGFMYGAAVAVLSTSWKHGEQLRIWHNLATQIHNEGEEANKTGGVLNPALLSIGE